jgi:hypothetical protein
MSGNARFNRGAVPVTVIRRPVEQGNLVKLSCAGDDQTGGYKIAYRGTVDQAIACLEACAKRLWELKERGVESEITPDPGGRR